MQQLKAYVSVARPDHWFKNILMLPGMAAAIVIDQGTRTWDNLPFALLGVFAACLVASSNYVINEALDAKTDRNHPKKKTRPFAAGVIPMGGGYVVWLLLAAIGLGLSAIISWPFFFTALWLWVMGIIYNVPPIRSKEVPHLDVLSEAVNNPIRMFLGWYSLRATAFPPTSLLLAYWMVGSFLMMAKRLAEYRSIGDPAVAASYRSSFKFYTQEKMLTAMLVYSAGFMFFVAVLMTKYHIEFILVCPLLMIYLGYYTHMTFCDESIVQTPELLFRNPTFAVLTALLGALILGLAWVDIPQLDAWLGVSGQSW